MVEQRTLNPSVQSSSLCAPTRFQLIVIHDELFSFVHSLKFQADPISFFFVVFSRLISFCLSVCLIGALPVVSRADSLDDIVSQLVRRPTLVANYTAEKKTAGIPVPLISHGTLTVSERHGLIWETRSPFVSFAVFTDTHAGFSNNGKQWVVRPQGHMQAYIEQIEHIVSGRLDSFREQFLLNAQLDSSSGRWSLIATPKHDRVQSMINEIAFFGRLHVERILITQSNGDTTRIVFENIEHPENPDQSAVRLFEAIR